MSLYAELTIDQGTTFANEINLTNDDSSPKDITGYSFESQIRKSYYSTNPTANIDITITSEVGGNIRMSIDSANTANIKAGRYLYDLKMTTDEGIVTRIIEGIITVTPQVSKP